MKYRGLKRAVSGVLAGFMLLSCTSGAVVSFAAEDSYIRFKTPVPSGTARIIEGNAIGATAKIPSDHMFKDPPFAITKGGNPVDNKLISITTNPGNTYTITANKHSASNNPAAPSGPDVADSAEYSLIPQLMAITRDGTGNVNVPTIPAVPGISGDPGTPEIPGGNYYFDITSEEKLSITTPSKFTFSATSTEGANGSISYGTITTATGEFSKYKKKQVFQIDITNSGSKKTIKFSIDGGPKFTLTTTMPSGSLIANGSTFTVNYSMKQIDPLILTVVTPKVVVEEAADTIRDKPTDTDVTDTTKHPYIKLATGETTTSITTPFYLLAHVKLYNTNDTRFPKVNWTWVPDDPRHIKVVSIGEGGKATVKADLNIPEEDVSGKLTATVEYTTGEGVLVTSKEVSVPINILGKGLPPKLEPIDQTVGRNLPIGVSSIPELMDVYDEKQVALEPKPPTEPYTFNAVMHFGSGRGRAEKAVIRATGATPDAIKVYVDNAPVPYNYGEEIINGDKVAGRINLKFLAVKSGQVTLHFDYYVMNKGKLVLSDSSNSVTFVVMDTTPSDYKQLSSLILQSPELAAEKVPEYPSGIIGFGFKAENYNYSNVEIPYSATTINLSPAIPPNKGVNSKIHYVITQGNGASAPVTSGDLDLASDKKTIGPIPTTVGTPCNITLTITAENGTKQLYILAVNRLPPSRDSSLKDLTVTDDKGVAIIKGFSHTQLEYAATVPYGTRWAKFVTKTNDPWATQSFAPTLIPGPGNENIKAEWMKLLYPKDSFGDGSFSTASGSISHTTEQKITVQAQDITGYPDGSKMYTTTYTVKITRADPSKNNFASELTIKDHKDRPVNFDGGAKFDKNVKNYFIHIPYSAEKLNLSILPEDILAQSVKVTTVNGKGETVKETPYEDDNIPLLFTVDTPVESDNIGDVHVKITFTIKAESGDDTTPPYVINVVRNDPDLDDTLTSLEVKDQNDAPVKTFSFNPQTENYTFTVPFVTEQVRVKPVPRSELATVKVNGTTIDTRTPYHSTALKAGETKNIKVEIFPEAKGVAPRVYNLAVTRELPSSDARLKDLVVTGGEDFRPRFAPNTTTYQVKIPEGTKTVTFTPTPLAIGATITINGVAAEGGKPSEPYEPYEARSVVKIEVTAQDGKTKMTYTINVTNQNLIPKSSDADLASLEIREGSMSPRFKPGITEYEVAVKDDISSVDILPVPRSEEATLKVLSDTKELGDYYDRYSTFIRDGENIITVEVTAENGKDKKEYQVTVYRKDEEKQGTYKPVTADMVDFTTNPIVVDISRYTVIAAEVFNTLKEEYPEKTMVFEGNDYSLQLNGKDMDMLVPHAAIYDLGLTFSSPNEDAIWDFIFSHPRNDDLEPVFIHFNHHGALPGKMLFTISLGRNYRTQNATWNYYNEERDRIDYYGGVRTNSRGTFTVPITHMSTYIYSEKRIDGAEIKTGEYGQIGDITGGASAGKTNPNTGVGGQK